MNSSQGNDPPSASDSAAHDQRIMRAIIQQALLPADAISALPSPNPIKSGGHLIVRQRGRVWQCTRCGVEWQGKPKSCCLGRMTYTWATRPAHLLTKTMLRRERLLPGGPALAVIRAGLHGENIYDLYDRAQALPLRPLSAMQQAQIEMRRAAALAARTCQECQAVFDKKKWLISPDGICSGCMARRHVAEDWGWREGARLQARQWAQRFIAADRQAILHSQMVREYGGVETIAVVNSSGDLIAKLQYDPRDDLSLLALPAVWSEFQTAAAPYTCYIIEFAETRYTLDHLISRVREFSGITLEPLPEGRLYTLPAGIGQWIGGLHAYMIPDLYSALGLPRAEMQPPITARMQAQLLIQWLGYLARTPEEAIPTPPYFPEWGQRREWERQYWRDFWASQGEESCKS